VPLVSLNHYERSPGDPGQFNWPTSTRRMGAGRKERSRCRLDSLARSSGLLTLLAVVVHAGSSKFAV